MIMEYLISLLIITAFVTKKSNDEIVKSGSENVVVEMPTIKEYDFSKKNRR